MKFFSERDRDCERERELHPLDHSAQMPAARAGSGCSQMAGIPGESPMSVANSAQGASLAASVHINRKLKSGAGTGHNRSGQVSAS